MPQIKKRVNKYFAAGNTVSSDTSGFGANSTQQPELLKTIKFSNNFLNMKLPAAAYEKVTYATLPSANAQKSRHQSKMGQSNTNASTATGQISLVKSNTK